MDSLDNNLKLPSTKPTNTCPWQNDLQLNLETWRQISKDGDVQRTVIRRKPLKLNFEYLETYVEKAKNCLKKRSQQEILLNRMPSS